MDQNATFCKFTWEGDQWDGKAKHFQTFVIQLKYKAASVHIGYLTNPEMQSKLMYFDHYAFTDDCFNKTGGMSPQQVIQDDQAQNNESQETNFTEEKLLDELSNIDDITSLPEEEQLKPEIIEEEVYDDPTVYNDDQDLNDLLNRVDDLLNSYSN